jgi:hypothetical protein
VNIYGRIGVSLPRRQPSIVNNNFHLKVCDAKLSRHGNYGDRVPHQRRSGHGSVSAPT